MSCVTVDRLKSRNALRSYLSDTRWFHNSIQHLQKWHGWQYIQFKSPAKSDHRSTWYVADSAAPAIVIRRQISEDSVDFFEKFATLREKADRPRRRSVEEPHFAPEFLRDKNEDWKPQPAPRSRPRTRIVLPASPSWIWGPELIIGPKAENVYAEVLFSIVHAISFVDLPTGADDVLLYLRNAFQVSETKHQELLDGINQRSPPEVTLQLGLVEARNLKGKDVNGLSDPYCTMWLSSNRQKQQNSTMKPQTLSPAWNEQFNFTVKEVNDDVLHVEIWHFNAEETVKDKMSRFGEVKDYRGFGKLLKGIAVASKVSGKPTPEFLGLLAIPLKVVPISGMERWFPLVGRDPNKPKERGEAKLTLALSVDKKDVQLSLKERYMQYELCLRSFIEYELRLDQEWRGKLKDTASMILRQFAAHRGLRPAETDVCLWSIYGVVIRRRTLDFALVFSVLTRLDKAMDHGKLPEEIAQIFRCSSEKFIDGALSVVRHMRSNSDLNENQSNLLSLLQCLEHFADKRKTEFPNLNGQISEAITMGAADWLSHAIGTRRTGGPISDDDRLEHSIRVCQMLMTDLKSVMTRYNESFLKTLQIPCFSNVYRYYDGQLFSQCKPVVDSISRTLRTTSLSEEKAMSIALEAAGEAPRNATVDQETAEKDSTPKLTMGTALFELYLCLQQFHKLSAALPPSERDDLKLFGFYQWFSAAVSRWLDIALYKALIRIGKAIALDSFTPVDPLTKYSSSAVDTVAVFYQIKTFWEQLAWPDAECAMTFVLKIVDDVNRCSTFYAEVICSKLERQNMNQSGEVFYVNQSVCVAVNNIIHVRHSIEPLADRLASNNCTDLRKSKDDGAPASGQGSEQLAKTLASAMDNINSKLEEIYFSIARRIESEVMKILETEMEVGNSTFYVDRLIPYLDANLEMLNSRLETATFERLLMLISQRVLHTFHNSICKDIENKRQPAQFVIWENILNVLTNFFYGTDSSQMEEKEEVLGKIRHLLKLHGSESSYLMQQYHLERMAQPSEDLNLGTVTVRALFVDEKLTVDVLNARNLKRVDAKANPYVKVRLVPRDRFPESVTYKTKVQKNTVFPLFDESFTFQVPHDLQTQPESFVVLTVKDYDLLGANEFMGEAFLSFEQITRSVDRDNQGSDQVHLSLSRPCNRDSEYLQVLENRSWDKSAKEFAKRERKRMNCK